MNIELLNDLHFDPSASLLSSSEAALTYFARRDLLDEPQPGLETLWELPEAARLVKTQHECGGWQYPSKPLAPDGWENYTLLETYRNLRILVEKYGMEHSHPAIRRAAEYIFSCQGPAGDIRGILGNQAMPYYHGALLELLVKCGYAQDGRLLRGLEWLLDNRQADGGWLIPTQALSSQERTEGYWTGETFKAGPHLPHSHLATGMALRALAAHPDYSQKPEAHLAGERLKERFFKPDRYSDRKTPDYWLKLQFPFWWTSLLTALDTLSRLGFQSGDPDVSRGLDWFIHHQEPDGLWPTGYGKGRLAETNRRWVGLAVCRVFRAFSRDGRSPKLEPSLQKHDRLEK